MDRQAFLKSEPGFFFQDVSAHECYSSTQLRRGISLSVAKMFQIIWKNATERYYTLAIGPVVS